MELYPGHWLLYLTAILLLLSTHTEAKSKTININLNSKWNSTPLLLEASEYLAQENNDYFWDFVNQITEMDPSSYNIDNEQEMYKLSLKLAESMLSPLKFNLLKFALALRNHSPTIAMNNQIAKEKLPSTDCDAFIEINNLITCELGAAKAMLKVAEKQSSPMVIKNDHHYPGSKDRPKVAILYGQLGSKSFAVIHKSLRQLALDGEIDYIVRHYTKDGSFRKTGLSGYGVELAIKSQEYKAKDDTKVDEEFGNVKDKEDEDNEVQGFLFSELKGLYPDLKDNLKRYKQHLLDSTSEIAPLKAWQMQDLSFQAAQKVLNAEPNEALNTLKEISQNFPIMTKGLSQIGVQPELKKAVSKNQREWESNLGLQSGDSAFFINGLQADLDVYDVFTLLDTMKSEAKLMEGLYKLGIQDDELSGFLKLDLRENNENYAVDIRDPSVVYINNLEKDKRYSSWPSSLQDLLRPTFPGMLRHIRKNLFHVIFFVDPSTNEARDLVKMAEAFFIHNAPVRIGLVLVAKKEGVDPLDDAGLAMSRAFAFIKDESNAYNALSFLTDVYEKAENKEITPELVVNTFLATYPAYGDEVFAEESPLDKWLTSCSEFFSKTGLNGVPQVLINGVPLSSEEIQPDAMEESLVGNILKHTQDMQKDVYHGKLYDGKDIMEYLMSQPNVMPRLNSRVLNRAEKYLDFTQDSDASSLNSLDSFKQLPSADMTSVIRKTMHYATKKDGDIVRPVSVWVVTDLESVRGRSLLYHALKHLKNNNAVRIGVVHNPVELPQGEISGETGDPFFLTQAIQAALTTLSPGMAKSFITKLLKEEYITDLREGKKTLEDLAVNNMDFDAYNKHRQSLKGTFLRSHSIFCERVLEFLPGQIGVVANGKVIGPLEKKEDFLVEDFNLLEKFISKSSAQKIKDVIKSKEKEGNSTSEMIMRVAALMTSEPQTESRKEVPYKDMKNSVLDIPADPKRGPAYDVVAILDPVSRAAQKYTPLLMVLKEVANVRIRVFMNCREKLSDMPVKSFYRYVLQSEVEFDDQGQIEEGPTAKFLNMPQKPILTVGMEPPESWLVEPIKTLYDLDNIHLEELQNSVHAEYELEYLLLEGHCYDSSTGQPPRGLQFILGTNSTPSVMDTIVMANLGYFQLKATPGAWNLDLRPGRSLDIYQVTSHDHTDSPPGSSQITAVIENFKSKIIKVRVGKRPGMESEDLLGGKEDSGGLWDSISRKFANSEAKVEEEKDDCINIFSVASGHLYERFLRIMTASVMKHTKSKVKFWFLKNYLSPSFKDFIPHMAKEYGFEYELVQYKWPRWLHMQTEKQRLIWGYKILFLDVLFPLNVQKIIFVDADQIVRADLQELVDLDLEGNPYGYTPFCESRKEMDGFRFWKSGYWASHLANRKYHISALYVVDLKKFRRIAAGDRLRGQYQGLSADPNSLANLDQDLPNNMIHQVGIKSLPQEWLWCETWCSDSELASAKTIDLCNNPLTKEPKLNAAMRIVPEWKSYDDAIKRLWDKTYQRRDEGEEEEEMESPSLKEEL